MPGRRWFVGGAQLGFVATLCAPMPKMLKAVYPHKAELDTHPIRAPASFAAGILKPNISLYALIGIAGIEFHSYIGYTETQHLHMWRYT